jgi:hypothetical protein
MELERAKEYISCSEGSAITEECSPVVLTGSIPLKEKVRNPGFDLGFIILGTQ